MGVGGWVDGGWHSRIESLQVHLTLDFGFWTWIVTIGTSRKVELDDTRYLIRQARVICMCSRRMLLIKTDASSASMTE